MEGLIRRIIVGLLVGVFLTFGGASGIAVADPPPTPLPAPSNPVVPPLAAVAGVVTASPVKVLSKALLDWGGSAVKESVAEVVAAFAVSLGAATASWAADTATWMFLSLPSSLDGVPIAAAEADVGSAAVWVSWLKWVGFFIATLALVVLGVLVGIRHEMRESYYGKLMLVTLAMLALGAGGAIVGSLVTGTAQAAGASAAFVSKSLAGWTLLAATMSFLLGAIQVIWTGRGEAARETLKSVLTLMAVCGLAGTVVATALAAADRLAAAVIGPVLDFGSGKSFLSGFVNLAKQSGLAANNSGGGVVEMTAASMGTALLLMLVSILLVFALVIQMVVLLGRAAVLPVLVGFLPLAASFTNTRFGSDWFRKQVAWLVALILYKPVVAILLRLGHEAMANAKGGDLVSASSGAILMLLSAMALPATISILTPGDHSGGGSGFSAMLPLLGMGAMMNYSGGAGAGVGGGQPTGAAPIPAGSPPASLPPSSSASSGLAPMGAISGGAAAGGAASAGAGSVGAGALAAGPAAPVVAGMAAASQIVEVGMKTAQGAIDEATQ